MQKFDACSRNFYYTDSIIKITILYYKKGKIGDQYKVKDHVGMKIP